MSDGIHHGLEVVGDKNTTGEFTDGKHRKTWLPVELERDINRYIQHEDLDPDEPLIDRSKRTLLYWVERAAERAADVTRDDDYRRVSSHDLRRC